jgi:hypothetical protein
MPRPLTPTRSKPARDAANGLEQQRGAAGAEQREDDVGDKCDVRYDDQRIGVERHMPRQYTDDL